MKDQPRRGKGLDPDREKTCDWSRQKERKPKSQFRASSRKRKVTFSRGPVEGEILVTEWPNSNRQVTYLIFFRRGSTGESFLLSRANRLCSIFLHWLEEPGVLRVSVILLSSTRSKMAMVRPPATNPAQKNSFSYYLLPLRGRGPHFRFGVPANHLASLSFPFRCPAT